MSAAPDPLVLLPGMNCSSRLWDRVLDSPQLGPEVPQVRRPSLRGSSLDDCVDRLLEQLPVRFSLVGLSLGAIVALAITRCAPHRVGRLALLAVNPRPPRPEQQHAWAVQRRALAAGASARSLQEPLLPVLLAPGHRAELDQLALAMADDVDEADLDDQLAVQQTRVDERPALARIGVPTLVVAGALDALVPLARHEEVCAAVAGARLEVLGSTGHLSPLEAPDQVATALRRWFCDPSGSDA